MTFLSFAQFKKRIPHTLIFFPTVDEDFQYFRSKGYTGSLNDMHYNAFGDLGYTGSLNDRIHKYMTEKYGSFYEAMRDLRNGTSVFALTPDSSSYAVNGFDPSLVFDFEQDYYRTGGTDTTLNPAVTHTRASSATMTNSSGTIVTVGNNVPRTGHHIYNGNAWVNEGVLHESEARTNLVTYSEDFSTGWVLKNSTQSIVTGVTAPDGTENVTQLKETAITGSFQVYFLQAIATTWTVSVYIKQLTASRWVQLRPWGVGSGKAYATFSPSDGTLTDSGGTNLVSTSTENVGNGWYRVSLTSNIALVGGDGAAIAVVNSSTGEVSSRAGDATAGIYIYGAQLEEASTPSSYIPTSGSTVIRAAETLTVPAANLPYDSTNMSIQMDGKMTYADENTGFQISFLRWLKDGSNLIETNLTTLNATGRLDFRQEALNVYDYVSTGSNYFSPGTNVPFNFASRHGSTFLNGAEDGTALTANTTPTSLPDLSTTDLNLGYDFMGTIGKFRVWSDDLTDTGIATASAPTFTTEFAMTITTTGANETFTIPCQNNGTFNAGIEWGDGSVSSISTYNDANLTHTYATAGDHLIRIRGSFPNISFNNGGDKLKLKSVENLGTVGWISLSGAFYGCSNMTSFTTGTTDTSSVTSMSVMFRNCSSLTTLDLSSFDTSSVTSMALMFFACNSITTLDVSNFNTSLVTNMSNMFNSCSSLTTLDLSSFDTSSVTNMSGMFRECGSLTTLDVSNFNTSLVTSMGFMFYKGYALTSLVGAEDFDITGLNSTGALTHFISNGRMTTAQYDALLVKWDAQSVFSNMTTVNFGSSQYTAGSAAATARANLISSDGWTILDGGTA